MVRSVVLLVSGSIVGGAAIFLLADPRLAGWLGGGVAETASDGVAAFSDAGLARDGVPEPVAPPAPDSDGPLAQAAGRQNGGGYAVAKVAAYEQAAAVTETFELEQLIRDTVASPVSRLRDMRLAALLQRYAELDPAAAVDLGRGLYLDTRALVPLFEQWARVEPDAAIAELALITPAARQRQLALAILDLIGNDTAGFDRVAAGLPATDRTSFEIDALVLLAERDPAAALQAITASEQNLLMSLAMPRIAAAAARQDPAFAMSQAMAIQDFNLQQNYSRAVLDAWAEIDPEGAFAWLERADTSDIPEYAGAIQTLASVDADRMMALIEKFPPAAQRQAQQMALQALAEQDLVAAMALYEGMPPGQDKESAVQAIARAYGQQDPDGAMSWAKGLTPQSEIAIAMVLQGLAETDADRAVELVLREIEDVIQQGGNAGITSLSLMLSLTSSLGIDFGRVADRMLELDNSPNSLASSILSSAISSWSRNDSEAAINWTIANADRLDPRAFSRLGQQLAQQDAALALATMDRLPPAQRGSWLEGIASGMARNDPDAALNLVQRYRGQPGYDTAYASVASAIAQFDPIRASRMLNDAPESQARLSAAANVVRQWAGQDPVAAAQWAGEFPDERVRTQAMSIVAQTWAQQDADEARRWLMGLANGTMRDSALDSYLSTTAALGDFDPQLLDAYSTDAAGQRGASQAIVQIGRNDPDEAQRLLDLYITDDTVRRQTEESLARSAGSGGGNSIFLTGGGIVFL